MRFELMWINGGSGLNMAFSEVQELDWADIPELLEMMYARRKAEADAIRNARAKR
jgi:hypothetical protein